MPKIENDCWKWSKGKVMFITRKKLLPISVGCRYHRMRVLQRRLGGSKKRSHNMIFLTNKEKDIQGMELEATESWAINESLEVRVGGKPSDIGTPYPIQDRVCW